MIPVRIIKDLSNKVCGGCQVTPPLKNQTFTWALERIQEFPRTILHLLPITFGSPGKVGRKGGLLKQEEQLGFSIFLTNYQLVILFSIHLATTSVTATESGTTGIAHQQKPSSELIFREINDSIIDSLGTLTSNLLSCKITGKWLWPCSFGS